MKGVVYNEIDSFAAAWLRKLILFGHIAEGDVDERDIRDVCPDDYKGYAQVHAFAGIGVWSYALKQAGVSDDTEVWTGSCPCQPFSAAGRAGGFADERHLWPAFFHLIRARRPGRLFGEQVASKDGLAWLDLVQSDLEGEGYTTGAVDLCAAGVGAPHIRQRLFFMAHALCGRAEHRPGEGVGAKTTPHGSDGSLSRERLRPGIEGSTYGALVHAASEQEGLPGRTRESGRTGGLADVSDQRRIGRGSGKASPEPGKVQRPERLHPTRILANDDDARPQVGSFSTDQRTALRIEGPALGADQSVRGFWSGADRIWCRDGKYRPVESGTFPLAHGAPARVGRLRGYGNAIVAPLAKIFIEEAMKLMP